MMKQNNRFSRIFALLLALVLLTLPMLLTACGDTGSGDPSGTSASTDTSGVAETTVRVTLQVTNAAGEKSEYPVTMEKGSVLADAMKKACILEEDGIKDGMVYTISGETADYSVDQSYWAFYMDGEYMMTGAEETVLEDGAVYSFVHETMAS